MNAPGPTVAVIGAGLMGRWHAHAARLLGASVTGIVDLRDYHAHRLARRYGARVFPTVDALLANAAPDAVHVCTPPETQLTLIPLFLRRGIPALVEKPVGVDAPATEQLLREADRGGTFLCPVHQFVFQRGVRYVENGLDRLHPVRHVDYVACSAGAAGQSDACRDRVVGNILPHPLALIRGLFPAAFPRIQWDLTRTSPGEWRVAGTTPSWSVSLLLSMSGRPTRNTMRIIGEGGTAHLDFFHGFAVVEPPPVSRFRKALRPLHLASVTAATALGNLAWRGLRREPAYPGLRELVGEFYAAVSGNRSPPIAPQELLDVAHARDDIIQQADLPSVASEAGAVRQ